MVLWGCWQLKAAVASAWTVCCHFLDRGLIWLEYVVVFVSVSVSLQVLHPSSVARDRRCHPV